MAAEPCTLCKRPNAIPTTGHVCEPCRRPLPELLRQISALHMLAAGQLDVLLDEPAEPLPAAPVPARHDGAHVTGTRTAPLPLPVDRLDVTMPRRVVKPRSQLVPATRVVAEFATRRWTEVEEIDIRDEYGTLVTTYHRPAVREVTTVVNRRVPLLDDNGDQVYVSRDDTTGYISTASILDRWVVSWRDQRSAGEQLPTPTVVALAAWMEVRLDWACDYATELRDWHYEMKFLRVVLRELTGEKPPSPTRCYAPCRNCDVRNLWRHPEYAYPVKCHSCGLLMSDDEYDLWSRMSAAAARRSQPRHTTRTGQS